MAAPATSVQKGRHGDRVDEVESQRRPEPAAQRRVGQQAVGRGVAQHQQVEAKLPHPAPARFNTHAEAHLHLYEVGVGIGSIVYMLFSQRPAP